MSTYDIELARLRDDHKLTVEFGTPASNDQIVQDAFARLEVLQPGMGGRVLYITGRASMPVAFTIAHAVAHLYQAVAVFDPKMQAYIVTIAHGGEYVVGDVLTERKY